MQKWSTWRVVRLTLIVIVFLCLCAIVCTPFFFAPPAPQVSRKIVKPTHPETLKPEEHIMELTDDNFLEVCGKGRRLLVELYSPFCSTCHYFAPEYAELAKRVHNDPNLSECVIIARLNMVTNRNTTERFNVRFTPNLHLFSPNSDCMKPSLFTFYYGGLPDEMMEALRNACNETSALGK